MRVGLVLVTFNAEAHIPRALAAVAAQARPPDAVVIVDNASTDGTRVAIDESTRAWAVPVRVIASPVNLGFAAANNRAMEQLASCDLVALLNPDAFPEPGWLDALLKAAASHPEAASFASRLMRDGQPGRLDGAGDACHVSGLAWRHGHGQPLAEVPGALQARPVFSACAAAALYRRDDWVRAGGFDERFFCYAEDVDLGFRLQLAGRGCWYVPEAVAHHVGSASAGVGSVFAVYHGHRNGEWTFLKNMPASLVWRYLPLHLAASLAGLAFFAARGRAGGYLKAKWDALVGAGEFWRARRQVQATRVRSSTEVLALLDRSSLIARLRERAS
ncbi:MAG: glycosyltransferase family 2 protein [Acidobacteria bacterium]|nr:glycosyltransferase family 2 protein [Acidobacteriota bacterium]